MGSNQKEYGDEIGIIKARETRYTEEDN